VTVQAEITANATVENADTHAENAENAVAPEKDRSGRHTLEWIECIEFRLCRTRFDSLTFFRRAVFILTLCCWLPELLYNPAVPILLHSGSLRQEKFGFFFAIDGFVRPGSLGCYICYDVMVLWCYGVMESNC
jgi:hypothetical protein